VLKLSRQPYYRWLATTITPGEVVEAYRANALFDAHRDDPEFGHRLLADEARDAGETMSDRVQQRLVQRVRETQARQAPPARSSGARRSLRGRR